MERSLFDIVAKKKLQVSEENKEFMHILNNVIAIVGIEYIGGLVEEKLSYGS